MQKRMFITFLLLSLCVYIFGDINQYAYWECAYYAADTNLQNTTTQFFQNFTQGIERTSYTYVSDWTTGNNAYPAGVDYYDLVVYAGHGSQNYITTMNGGVDLSTAGNNSNEGYGLWLKVLLFYSCRVVASPIDVADWATPWLNEPGGIFDGLHVLCGFRTDMGIDPSWNMANYMGQLTYNHSGTVVENWINSVETYGMPWVEDRDNWCVMAAFRNGYYDDPAWDAYYDVYGISMCNNSTDQNLWCGWME